MEIAFLSLSTDFEASAPRVKYKFSAVSAHGFSFFIKYKTRSKKNI